MSAPRQPIWRPLGPIAESGSVAGVYRLTGGPRPCIRVRLADDGARAYLGGTERGRAIDSLIVALATEHGRLVRVDDSDGEQIGVCYAGVQS